MRNGFLQIRVRSTSEFDDGILNNVITHRAVTLVSRSNRIQSSGLVAAGRITGNGEQEKSIRSERRLLQEAARRITESGEQEKSI